MLIEVKLLNKNNSETFTEEPILIRGEKVTVRPQYNRINIFLENGNVKSFPYDTYYIREIRMVLCDFLNKRS